MTFAVFANGSRPLSGNLFSLRSWGYVLEAPGGKVLVPYRGIYFLYLQKSPLLPLATVLVPYRGIYFLYGKNHG